MTLSGHFTLNFHYYEQSFHILHTYRRAPLWNIFVVSRDEQRCAEADRDPQNIWDPLKDCGSFVDEKLRAIHRRNLNKQGQHYYSITYSLIAFPLTPKHGTWPWMTLNCLFCVKFCFAPIYLEFWSLAFEAWLLLNLYWMLSGNFEAKRTAAASRGFLSDSTVFVVMIAITLSIVNQFSLFWQT